MHKNSETSPAFRQGDCPNVKTTIILSAPGRAEEKASRPAAGGTGKTLQKAIEIFHEKSPDTFPSKNLDDYTIVNAVGEVHYKGKTGRTEGSNKEICDIENIERLVGIISGSACVVVLGDKAQLAILETGFNGVIYFGGHPSMQALNRKYSSDKQTSYERSSDRIGQWANDVLDSPKN